MSWTNVVGPRVTMGGTVRATKTKHPLTPEPTDANLQRARQNVSRAADRISRYDAFFAEASKRYGVPQKLLVAVALKESSLIRSAQNPPAGEALARGQERTYGLMQVTEGLLDPKQNIMKGASRLSEYFQLYGDWNLALAAYNAGPRKVGEHIQKTQTNSPMRYTNHYIAMVKAYVTALEELSPPSKVAQSGWIPRTA